MQRILYIAVAGAFGTVVRYLLGGAAQRLFGPTYPVGTLVVNSLGCFLFGLFWSYAEQRLSVSPQFRILILIGFMGSFTTFSSFSFETTQLLRDAQWFGAGVNIVLHNTLGLCLMYVGLALGRIL